MISSRVTLSHCFTYSRLQFPIVGIPLYLRFIVLLWYIRFLFLMHLLLYNPTKDYIIYSNFKLQKSLGIQGHSSCRNLSSRFCQEWRARSRPLVWNACKTNEYNRFPRAPCPVPTKGFTERSLQIDFIR